MKKVKIFAIVAIGLMVSYMLIGWINKEKNFNHGICSECGINLELKAVNQAAHFYQCPKCKKTYTHYQYF